MATVLVKISGTRGTFEPNEVVNVIVKFMESGNYLISSLDGKKRCYASKDEISLT